jgi:hypothetical protein
MRYTFYCGVFALLLLAVGVPNCGGNTTIIKTLLAASLVTFCLGIGLDLNRKPERDDD